jgi:hypothetical protein
VKTGGANWPVALAGALAGGIAGHFLFVWIARQGFYALVLPGALIGCVGGWLLRRRSPTFAVVCCVLALATGVVSEWRLAPFVADNSFSYFITHLHQLRPFTLIMIGLGALFAVWFGLGRSSAPVEATPPRPA